MPDASGQVYTSSDFGGSFKPMAGIPAGYVVHRVEKDNAGNVLFVLKDPAGKYAALLYDGQQHVFDYSAFVAGHQVIHHIRSGNFLQNVIICAEDGLSYKSVRYETAVQCLLEGYSLRGIVEIKPGQFIITSENKPPVLYHADTGKLEEQTQQSPWVQAFSNMQLRRVDRAPDGTIWGANGGKIVQYDPATSTHRDFAVFPTLLYQTRMADGRMAIISADQGLVSYDPASGDIRPMKNGEKFRNIKGIVHWMSQTEDGLLWLLTTNGLWQINPVTGVQKRLGFETPFRDFRFICLAEAPDGRLWFGTFLGGIQIYDPGTGAVQVVDKSKGLPNNTVVSIVRDEAGDFWAGTYGGLVRLSPDGVVMSNLFGEEGLCELEFNRYACLRARSGDLLMGTINGLHIIRPKLLERRRKTSGTPHIYLTSLTVADNETMADQTHQTGFEDLTELTLPPERRFIRLRFALSEYSQPDRNQYAYMLEGMDKNWTHIGSQHELTFNDLPPGQYALLIKGCDSQGNWTEKPWRINIRAREFFYKKPWFYALCLLPFVAFGLVWMQRLRSEKIRLENEVKKRTRQIQSDKALIEQQASELLKLDELKSRFFTNISHELRTPITLITAPVEKLLQSYQGKDDHREALQRVLYNGRKLGSLVEELLELSRLEAGKSELQETATEFYPYCRQIYSAFESQAQIKRIRYTFDYSAEKKLLVAIDRRRLEKIITNLISNAVKFTPPDGAVRVSVEQSPIEKDKTALLVIRVEDTGRGIPPEDMPHLFERYFQTKRLDSSKEGGTGIGLALAKELASLMKGALTVESTWGEGSTFSLSVPLKMVPEMTADAQWVQQTVETGVQPAAPLPARQPGQANKKRPHILIVEDNQDMQNLLQTLLADDYRLTFTGDGWEAWEKLVTENPEMEDLSLILSDVMMPRMDGYQLLNRIKLHARWQQIPVILLTARAEEQDKLQALRLGVDDYLVKPFSPPELSARLSNLIANYRRRQTFASKATPDITFDHVEATADIWLKSIETAAKTALEKGLPLLAGDLAEAGNMSERQFYREIKRVTGLTPNQYILEVKLQKARHLLQSRAFHTLAEVAYAVGFDTPGYFTKVFETHFGKHPSAYLETNT